MTAILGASSAMFAAAGVDQITRGATGLGALFLVVAGTTMANCVTWTRRFEDDQGHRREPSMPGRTGTAPHRSLWTNVFGAIGPGIDQSSGS